MVNHQHGYRVGVHSFRLGKLRNSVHERETPQIAGLATDAGHSSQTAREEFAGRAALLGWMAWKDATGQSISSQSLDSQSISSQGGTDD